jgi:hypothetical protein
MTAEEKKQRGLELMAEIEQERRAAFARHFPMEKFAKELAILQFADMKDFDGKEIKDIKPKYKTKAIKSISYTKWGRKLELYDKTATARLVVDIMGLKEPQVNKHEVEFNEGTLNAILRALPDGVREVVRRELTAALSAKRD